MTGTTLSCRQAELRAISLLWSHRFSSSFAVRVSDHIVVVASSESSAPHSSYNPTYRPRSFASAFNVVVLHRAPR